MGVDFQGLSKNYSNQTTILKHFWFFQIYTQMIPNVYWKLFQQKPFKQKNNTNWSCETPQELTYSFQSVVYIQGGIVIPPIIGRK